MKIEIAQGSTVIFGQGTAQEEICPEGHIIDVEEAIGEALVKGGSAKSVIESRPDVLMQ